MAKTGKGSFALFDGRRLTIARTLRGLTKTELAGRIDVTPGAISQYEGSLTRPSGDVISRLALALAVPAAFFEAGRPLFAAPESDLHFRRLRTSRKQDRARVASNVALLAEVVATLEEYLELPEVGVPQNFLLTEDDPTGIESVAQQLRSIWELGVGPIADMVGLLEIHGVVVTRLRAEVNEVDAFSGWIGKRPFVVLNADKDDAARSRFDAAHELGHLLLHHDAEPGSPLHERQANQFASAFLLPRSQILKELPQGLDWRSYVELKYRWRVSIQALLRRALDVGVLTQTQFTSAMKHVSQRGWRKAEPGEIGRPEQPALVHRATALAETEFGVSLGFIADRIKLGIDDVRSVLGEGAPQVRLRVLPDTVRLQPA